MSLTKTRKTKKVASKTRASKKTKRVVEKSLSNKRKRAIEKAITFWKNTQLDLSGFSFNREEANAR
jgi:hypothetical protein